MNELVPYCDATGAHVGHALAYNILDECDATITSTVQYVSAAGTALGTSLPSGWVLCSDCCPDRFAEILCWTRTAGGGSVTTPIEVIRTLDADGVMTVRAYTLTGAPVVPVPPAIELYACPPGGVSSLFTQGTNLIFVNEVGVSATIDLCAAATACGISTGGGGNPMAPVATGDLAEAALGSPMIVNLAANDQAGNGPSTWAFVSGSLPPGTTLNANGTVTGTPSAVGNFTFTYRITDSDGDTATAIAGIIVQADATPNLADDTYSFDACTNYVRNLADNDTSMGNSPPTFQFVSGTIPPGMTLDQNLLRGTPNTPGVYTFTYQVTDLDGDTDTATVTVTVTGTTGGCTNQVVSDSFASGSGAFTHLGGTLTVGSGVGSAGAAVDVLERHATTIGSNDGWVSIDVNYLISSPTSCYVGVDMRLSADGLTRYYLEASYDNTYVELVKVVAGVPTSLGSTPVTMPAPGTSTIKLEVVGTTLRGYVNGTLVIGPITDSSITGPAFAGFNYFQGGAGRVTVDNFKAGTCGTGGTSCDAPPTSGQFEINANGQLIDPCGAAFRPVGGAIVSKPTGPLDAWWAEPAYSYGNGNVARAVADGWNAAEVMVPIPGPSEPFTMQQSIEGLGQLLNEWTAQGIVCIVYPWWSQGYNPATYAAAPAEVRAVQDYLCANYKTNPYVWLETLGESHGYLAPDGSGVGSSWATAHQGMYDDATAKGWTNIQVHTLPGYGNGILVARDSNIITNHLLGKNKVVIGWHNFGSQPSVSDMVSTITSIRNKKIPIICTSFGQNWKDGDPAFGGDNPGSDAVGVDFTLQHGFSTFTTGGLAWLATGKHDTNNKYSWRYATANGGVFRPWYDTGEARNEVGQGILAAGLAGGHGGGPSTRTCSGTGGGGGGGGGSAPVAGNDTATGTVGLNFTFDVKGNDQPGAAPSTWTVAGGSLPPGLTMNSNGVISGTPTTAGTYTATYQIRDSALATSSATVTITINTATANGPVAVADLGIDEFLIGVSHLYYIGWNDSLGVQPSTFAVVSGSLPAGLTMNSAGEISGTPTTAGTSSFTYRITDSNGQQSTASASIIIPTNDGGGGTPCAGAVTVPFSVNGGAAQNGLLDLNPNPNFHGGFVIPLTVTGGRARPSQLGPGYGDCIAFGNNPGNDQFAEADIVVNPSFSSSYTGVMVRGTQTGNPFAWFKFEVWGGRQDSVRWVCVLNNVIAEEGYIPWTITPGQTYRFRLQVVGNTYTGSIGGSQVFSVTRNYIASGRPAITIYNANVINETEVDNFQYGAVC